MAIEISLIYLLTESCSRACFHFFFQLLFIAPRRDFAQLARILRKVLTVEIYGPYARKNLDLLEQGPRGIGR